MKHLTLIIFSILFVAIISSNNENWAVLIAGSEGYGNYRHQSDIFHAYQILMSQGFSKDNVIVFAYDDIVMDIQNPFPGKVFNSPSGSDVYEGVVIDYKKNDVTPENFFNVLLGKEELMKNIGSGKVLKSTSKNNVFIYYSDHGSSKMLIFPQHIILTEDKLYNGLKKMYEKKNYNQVVFYVEACYSGSMFLRLPTDWNIYVTTASNPYQSSYASFCGPSAKVQGQLMNTCLGDEYSTAWMTDTISNKDNSAYTLFKQYQNLRKRVKGSEVCVYGDVNYAKNNAIEIIFISGSGVKWKDWEMELEDESANSLFTNRSESDDEGLKVNSRDAYLYNMKYQAMVSNDPWSIIDYKKELELTKKIKKRFEIFRNEFGLQEDRIVNGETDYSCVNSAFELYKSKCGFAERDIRYLNDLTNACTLSLDPSAIIDVISSLCDLTE